MKKSAALILSLITITVTPTVFANHSYHVSSSVNHAVKYTISDTKSLIDLSDLLHSKYVFALRDPKTGNLSYTQSGEFIWKDDYLYQNRMRLQGYNISTELVDNACQLSDIKLLTLLPAHVTTQFNPVLNLDANSAKPDKPFDPNDYASFNYVITAHLYDSLGAQHGAGLFFAKNTYNDWFVHVVIDGSVLTKGRITFKTNGEFDQAEGLANIIFNPTGAAQQVFSISLERATQFATPSSVFSMDQDGRSVGHLSSVDVDEIGYVNQYFTNGEVITAGKIAVLPKAG